MSNKSKKGYSGTVFAKQRRKRVIPLLELDLNAIKNSVDKARKSPDKRDGSTSLEWLTKSQARIEKEIETLKHRV